MRYIAVYKSFVILHLLTHFAYLTTYAKNPVFSPHYIPLDYEHSSKLFFYKENNKREKNIGEITQKLFLSAQQAIAEGKLEEALELFDQLIKLNPQSAQAHYNKGLILQELKKTEEARKEYLISLEIDPHYSKASLELGIIYRNRQDIPQAKKYLKQAIEYNAGSIDALHSLARLYTAEGDFTQAIDYLQQAMLLNSEDQITRFELANNLNMVNRSSEALEHYYYILKKSPTNSSILYNIGYTLKKLGKLPDAMKFYHEALLYNPEHVEAHFSLGLLYLCMGDFERGWPLYEWRWKRDVQVTPRNMNTPLWNGGSLINKTIYVHAEQGYGDTFMFVRFCKNLKELGAKIILGIQRGMIPVIKELSYIDQIIVLNDPVPEHDVQAPLLSLPYLLKTTIQDLPGDIPYLQVNKTRDTEWKERLEKDKNFKVGICFHGNDNYTPAFIKAVIAKRPIPLPLLNPLSDVVGVTYYSLQKESGMDELNDNSINLSLKRFDDTFDQDGRFVDTAAIIKNLDLIITIDTSIAHLAGGLGKEVWVLLPNPPDWRWMHDRTDSPWYPTMKLFIQPVSDDWESVVTDVKNALEERVHGKKNCLKTPLINPLTEKKVKNSDEIAHLDKQLYILMNEIKQFDNSSNYEIVQLKMKLFSNLVNLKNILRKQL